MLYTIGFSVLATNCGLIVSFYTSTKPGGAIVLLEIAFLILVLGLTSIWKRR